MRIGIGLWTDLNCDGRFASFDYWRCVEKAAEHRRSPRRFARLVIVMTSFVRRHSYDGAHEVTRTTTLDQTAPSGAWIFKGMGFYI